MASIFMNEASVEHKIATRCHVCAQDDTCYSHLKPTLTRFLTLLHSSLVPPDSMDVIGCHTATSATQPLIF